MAATRFRLNFAGVGQLLRSSGMAAEMRSRAENVAAAARSAAPVDTGEYRDSITVETATTDRAVGRCVATAPHSLVVEARTRVLGSSIDAAGG